MADERVDTLYHEKRKLKSARETMLNLYDLPSIHDDRSSLGNVWNSPLGDVEDGVAFWKHGKQGEKLVEILSSEAGLHVDVHHMSPLIRGEVEDARNLILSCSVVDQDVDPSIYLGSK